MVVRREGPLGQKEEAQLASPHETALEPEAQPEGTATLASARAGSKRLAFRCPHSRPRGRSCRGRGPAGAGDGDIGREHHANENFHGLAEATQRGRGLRFSERGRPLSLVASGILRILSTAHFAFAETEAWRGRAWIAAVGDGRGRADCGR
ncbi:hypothetical protein SMALA_8517 [Streptomyces malaysiensis subsp. malaysiensis]|nr:hypothetical protein SMALA_8517 [Streptomyces malaysiensis]